MANPSLASVAHLVGRKGVRVMGYRQDWPAAEAKPAKPVRTGREGKHLERLLVASPQTGVVLTRIEQASRVIRPKGKPLLAVKVPGCVDFVGTLWGGRSLFFDAKESAEPNRLKTDEPHLAEHQRALLVTHGKAGAVAGLMSLRTTDSQLFWVSWRLLEPRRASVLWSDAVAIGSAGLPIQWARLEGG